MAGTRWANASPVPKLRLCQESMWWNTPRGASAAKSAATKPEDVTAEPAGPGSMQPFPDGSSRLGQLRHAPTMLPPCTHPMTRIGIVGLARPSIREPHLRARRPTTDHCKGRLADQAHLIKPSLTPPHPPSPPPAVPSTATRPTILLGTMQHSSHGQPLSCSACAQRPAA